MATVQGNRLKVVIPGGSGQVGTLLARSFHSEGHDVVVLSRRADVRPWRVRQWDGSTLGPWQQDIECSDVVINLAGRSVNCRYTAANSAAMMASRVESTRVVGEAIARAAQPPRVWLQMSTATIYAHRFDAPNDELGGLLGGADGAPASWRLSIDIATAWERELAAARTPRTRKVAMRSAMVMSPDRGGVFDVLLGLTRWGLGGVIAGGRQWISWIHERDFVRSVELLLGRDDFSGAVNLASPNPLPQREFMAALREAWGIGWGLPATQLMAAVGAFCLRTDTELVLKSRRVVPGRLTAAGFRFDFPDWPEAAQELVARVRGRA